jgi:hypothetical protein
MGGGCWELDSKKENHPTGYRYQDEQAYVSLDDDDDDGIEFVIVDVPVKEKDMYSEYEILILDDALLTETMLINLTMVQRKLNTKMALNLIWLRLYCDLWQNQRILIV